VTTRPFDDVPRTARGHLGLLFYEAAFAVVAHARTRAVRAGQAAERVFDQFPSLAEYVAEIRRRMPEGIDWRSGSGWLRGHVDEWSADAGASLPFVALERDLGIGRDSRLMLAVLGLVEEDAAFAALFAALQAPLPEHRPMLGTLRELAQELPDAAPDAWTLCRPLIDAGLAEVLNPDAPRSEWLLRVPPPIWTALRGDRPAEPIPGVRHQSADGAAPLADLIVTERQRGRLRQIQPLLAEGRVRTVIVRGPSGCERTSIVAALAAETGRGLLEVRALQAPRDDRLPRLGPLCTLLRAVPVFTTDLGPSEVFTVPSLAGYTGPLAIIVGREGGVSDARHGVTIDVDPDPAALRLQYWHSALGSSAGPDVARIADTFTISGAHIRQCAPLAVSSAALDGRAEVSVDDVRGASRAISRQILESLATPLEAAGGWGQLVVGAGTELDLHDLEQRCRHRERLASAVGAELPGGLNRGVRALFEGPSGCGKTLAARALATQVGLDVYRVDLASVINKFIGETEKNLSRILSRAEGLPVIVLLDEGDALLARRTDVRSSNDRYANVETNYLLQRLETYDGIVVITTNLGAQIDPAFRRRMDVVVKFHLPDAEQRWQLWHLHLPKNHAVNGDAIEEMALRHQMSGGQIRNATVHAALSALSRGGAVEAADLVAGVELEHRKAGASYRRASDESMRDSDEPLDRFVGAIS
jgi:ATPase family associated with various cellular activities (AAA)